MIRKRGGPQVFAISGARKGLAEDVAGRQRRYVISMLVRCVAVLAAALLWNVERYVAVVALVLGTFMPYVAVIAANAGRENAPSGPSPFVPVPVRPALGPVIRGDDQAEGVPEDEESGGSSRDSGAR
ncbi:hypothetical protein SRB5_23920 [Streptomyces sp. RB5]|uniref:DUF3099 domain-containing protein n=1 Tax=Streptomyces smaragdinus TaxID=2585196 RepID=A0A7K0CFK7_9ACTN|nr:DUF3099 domain-containing protein [Streptomyces smaragdinus]MQY12259.1 hypothetical protein [Streptomyces smaragdinus]